MRVSGVAGLFLGICACLPGSALAVTLTELRAMQDALDAARADFAQLSGRLSDAEAADYRAYIEQLNDRLASGCSVFVQTGGVLSGDLKCPQSSATQISVPLIDQRGETTRSERTAILDAELDNGLGEFDERLLREQQRVKAGAPPSGAGTGEGRGAGAGSGSESGQGQDSATAGAQAESSRATTGGKPHADAAAGPPGGRTVTTGQPPDVPDGSDDDVVARQMREAAENETDPELKEKLWEEYRRYKRGVQ